MAVKRFSTSFISDSGQDKSSNFIANYSPAIDEMELIERVRVGSGGTSAIEFTNIPATYQHLQIRGIARSEFNSTGTDDIAVRFNGDTGSNYVTHSLYGTGSTAGATSTTGGTYMRPIRGALLRDAYTNGMMCGFVIDIIDVFSTTKNKTVRGFGGSDRNGEGEIVLGSGLWLSTAAISSITLIVDAGFDYDQHSTFSLYGVKA